MGYPLSKQKSGPDFGAALKNKEYYSALFILP